MKYAKNKLKNGLGYIEWTMFRAANKLRGAMKTPKVFFMHIPKTGGTSVKSAIYDKRKAWYNCHVDADKTREVVKAVYRSKVGRREYFRELFKLRQSIAVKYVRAKKPVITGHIPVPGWFLSEFANYEFFTIVRSPVNRWISDYRFSYEIDGLSTFFDGDTPDHPVDGVESALRSKCGAPQRHIYTNYFSGFGWISGLTVEEKKKEAIENIKKWDKIFDVKKMSEVEKFLSINFESNISIGKRKKTDSVDDVGLELKRFMDQKGVREEIKSALKSDMEVYRAAIARASQ